MASSSSAAQTGPSDVWLPGFAWPVPLAFRGAVSACRFEQGDVLHTRAEAYGDWSSGAQPGAWIQVLDPPRSARALGGATDASRFEMGWGSPVELELADDDAAAPRQLVTTQGRLFTCLWRGDFAALETTVAPAPPLGQGELQRCVEVALPALRKALGGGRKSPKATAAMLFVASVDRASDASTSKSETIASALATRFEVRIHDAVPGDLGIPDAERFHPTLEVRGVRIDAADVASVTDALKAVLYKPGAKGRERAENDGGSGEAAAGTDRFSLARHGLLVPLLEGPSPTDA